MTDSSQSKPKSRLRRCCGFLWRWSKRLVLFAVVAGIAYVLWANWYGQREAQRMLDELRQRGLATSYDELLATLPPIPPERDGTRYYRAAMELAIIPQAEAAGLPEISSTSELFYRGQQVSNDMAQRLSAFVERNAAFYDLSQTALAYDCAGYTGHELANPDSAFYSKVRRAARLLVLASLHRTAAGDANGAVVALTDVLRWSASLRRDPANLSDMVRLSIVALSTSELEMVLSRITPSAGALRDYRRVLLDECDSLPNPSAIEGDFAQSAEALQHPKLLTACQIVSLEQYIATDPYGEMRGMANEWGLPVEDAWSAPSTWRIRMGVDVSRIWTTICPGAQQIVDTWWIRDALDAYDLYSNDHAAFMDPARWSEPDPSQSGEDAPLRGVMLLELNVAMRQIVVTTAIDVECYRIEHGHWPESLDALPDGAPNDPCADAPLRYKRMDDGVIVYSVGSNRVDDGGEQDGIVVQDGDVAFRLFDPPVRGTRQPPPPPEPVGGGLEGMMAPDDARIAD